MLSSSYPKITLYCQIVTFSHMELSDPVAFRDTTEKPTEKREVRENGSVRLAVINLTQTPHHVPKYHFKTFYKLRLNRVLLEPNSNSLNNNNGQ